MKEENGVTPINENKAPLIQEHVVHDIFSGVRGLAVKVLNRIERTDAYLEKLLDNEMRNADLQGQDKALLYEIVHGVVRWMGRLDWILSGFYKGQFSKAIPMLKNALRVALYQIMFLDKIPEYAAVNEAVEFVKKLHGQKQADISNAVLRNILKNKNSLRYPDPETDLVGYLSAYYSHPSWIVKRWLNRFGREATEKLLLANNERPYLTLKINNLKVSDEEFEQLLNSVNLKFTRGSYNSKYFRLHNLTNITHWQYFNQGYFTIQDESAGLACMLLQVKPGMRVLDMCAAPGGKSAYISDLMNNLGEVVALEQFEARTEIMKNNLQRLSVTNVQAITADALTYKDEKLFDAILLDAPCSGLGTIVKKPDIKWKKDLQDVKKLTLIQKKLLEHASSLVKPGGVIVYSTCTIEPEENCEVVNTFLEKNKNFKLDNAGQYLPKEVVDENGCVQTYPHIHKLDGAFAARLIKTG